MHLRVTTAVMFNVMCQLYILTVKIDTLHYCMYTHNNSTVLYKHYCVEMTTVLGHKKYYIVTMMVFGIFVRFISHINSEILYCLMIIVSKNIDHYYMLVFCLIVKLMMKCQNNRLPNPSQTIKL